MVRVCLTLLLAALLLQGSAAWQPNARHYLSNSVVLRRPDSLLVVLKNSNTAVDDEQQDSWTEEGWSVADDWNALSSETNAGEDVAINQDIVQTAAQKMLLQDAEEPSQEDMWLNDVIENILQTPLSSTPLYDTGFAASQKTMASPEQQQRAFEENMAKEIAMLVRCNESPEDMLVQAGRALPELTTLQKTDVAQLLTWNDKQDNAWEPTPFLQEAIATMFKRHATAIRNNNNDTTTTTTTMDAKAVSRWMTQSMGSDLDSYTTRGRSRSAKDLVEDMDHSTRTTKKVVKIGPHDSRVLKLLSQYSKYGTGRLRLENLQQVYMDALTRLPNGMPVISDEDHNPWRFCNCAMLIISVKYGGI
ncbi:Ferredoxin [Seminavis robusta]|uniref:Ferredoxin n=1 Tax=Seminavis robusta TaxID=568900 RepID=A0A9N8HV30_9STRA|nr:Ferredoxin [Seminavis robusta]|eukprot:Sro1860_g302140.1 Ferredoxin (361) ;mRNA; f:20148-21230